MSDLSKPSGPDRAALWWSGGLRFQCFPGCGRCCGGEPGAIFFSPEEGAKVAAYLGMDETQLRSQLVTLRWGPPSFRERPNGDCVFYDAESARCSIYPVRPAQCRAFPFWPENLESPEAWEECARRCPGVNEGPLLSLEDILERLLDARDWTKK